MKKKNKRALLCTAIFLLLISGVYFFGPKSLPHSYEGAAAKPISKYQLNINTATVEELEQLDSIGKKKAQEIVIYRNKYGKYNNIEELQKEKGIGEKKFALWKEYLCVS